MTRRRPEELSQSDDRNALRTLRWLTTGLSPQSLILLVVGVLGTYYAQSTRVTVIEQQTPAMSKRMDEMDKRLDHQRDSVTELRETKVSIVTYEEDQRRIAEDLHAIKEDTGRIESALLTQAGRK